MSNRTTLKEWLISNTKKFLNIHRPGNKPDILIFGIPRGGSTWLMELIAAQPGFKLINEPFNLRNQRVKNFLKFSTWDELYQNQNNKIMVDYLRKIGEGRISFMDPAPTRKFYRFNTSRTVFKIIHACEEKVDEILSVAGVNRCGIILLRHPIAVSLSRKQLPRLNAFISSDCSKRFNEEQLNLAKQIVDHGSHLEKAILSWCFQNFLLLTSKSRNLSIITYEQLVMEPHIVLEYLKNRLYLTDLDKSIAHLHVPSGSSDQSEVKTVSQITSKDNPNYLISKWKTKVNREQEMALMKILHIFGIDAYIQDELISKRYWIS